MANLAAAASYAAAHQVRAGIAVLDLLTGAYYGAGHPSDLFGSASVVKVLIAVQLIITDQLHGDIAGEAERMIERSDDDAANDLWPLAGGPDVVNRIAAHYHISNLGTPNSRPGFWGNTHLTPKGLAYLYRALHNDPAVWPWLSNAMRHATRIAADGTNQYFGIPSAAKDWAVKQGWGSRSADNPNDAIVNTTGFVSGNRFVVVILAEGMNDNGSTDSRGYNPTLGAIVTQLAKTILPGGRL